MEIVKKYAGKLGYKVVEDEKYADEGEAFHRVELRRI